MADRVLRGNETVLLMPAYVDENGDPYVFHGSGVTPLHEMTTECLNYWIPVNSAKNPLANGGGNVSCAIKDDMALGKTDSDSDTDRTLCDAGQVEELTTENYEGQMNGYKDADPEADGAYNLFDKLTFAPDVLYVAAQRIGVRQNELATIDERWNLFLFSTDVQVPNVAHNTNITVSQTLIPKSEVEFGYELAA